MFFTPSPLLVIARTLEGPLSDSMLTELRRLRDWCLERLEVLSRGRWQHTAELARELQETYALVACVCRDVLESPELAPEAAEALREASQDMEGLEGLRQRRPLLA